MEVNVDKWLFNNIRVKLNPGERCILLDLIFLSSKNGGYVKASENVGYIPEQLAGILNVNIDLFNKTIEKLSKENIIEVRDNIIKVNDIDGFFIKKKHYKIRIISKNVDKSQCFEEVKNNEEMMLLEKIGIKKEVWESFIEMRKKIKKPMTDRAKILALNKLAEFKKNGNNPEKIIEQSVMNCWQGLFPLNNREYYYNKNAFKNKNENNSIYDRKG